MAAAMTSLGDVDPFCLCTKRAVAYVLGKGGLLTLGRMLELVHGLEGRPLAMCSP